MQPVTTPRVFSERYELTHLVARGGMAQVYRARDRLLDRPVALKVLFPELSVDRAFVERFRREAQAAANLSHPNIVPVFDWGEDGGTYYIVMEYVDGQPLSQVLREQGPMAPALVAPIGARVADALAYAHRHGVVHRDVKPGNVLLTNDQQVKVTDFGIARAVNTEESLTQTGAVMGTATYFSPEQAEGLGVDARSDVYSLGVVLYEMLVGRPPFLGDSPVAVASKHVRDRPPVLRDLNPEVPAALEAIVGKAMAKSADLRYQSAADMRSDLQRFSEGRSVTAPDVTATSMLAAGAAGAAGASAAGASGADPATQTVPIGDGRGDRGVEKSHAGRWIALLVLLLAVLGVVVYFVLSSLGYLGASAFKMPTVHGDSVSKAISALQADGLVVATRRTQHSTSVKKTVVISTTPVGGTNVKKGDHVDLLVSSGPVARITLPDEVGKTYIAAATQLTHLGLRPTERTVASTKPTGTVLSETPVANTKVKPNSTVVLRVSKQTTVSVPNVVGQTEVAAGSTIGSDNLAVGSVTPACSAKYSTGVVMAQTPAPPAKVSTGTKVNLEVSTGQCTVKVPTVVGATEGAAAARLSSKGLTATPTTTSLCSSTTTGRVLAETPHGGTTVPNGSVVALEVCRAPVTPPTTSTSTSTKTKTSTSTKTSTGASTGTLTATRPGHTLPTTTAVPQRSTSTTTPQG